MEKDGFHPHKTYKGVRKSRDQQAKTKGTKIRKDRNQDLVYAESNNMGQNIKVVGHGNDWMLLIDRNVVGRATTKNEIFEMYDKVNTPLKTDLPQYYDPRLPRSFRERKARDKEVKLEFKPASMRTKEAENVLQDELTFLSNSNKVDLEINPSTFLKATNNDPNWIPDHGVESVKKIKERIEEGRVLDKPYLIIIKRRGRKPEVVSHEGRHRAYTAKKLGVKKIPIEVYCSKGTLFGADCQHITEDELRNSISQLPSFKEFENKLDVGEAIWTKNKEKALKEIEEGDEDYDTIHEEINDRKQIQKQSEKVFSK